MKVVLAVPRFKFIWPCSERWQMEASFALAGAGHELSYISGDQLCNLDVQKAREYICQTGIEMKADVVVMCDQDQYMSGPETVKLAEECLKGGWAYLQAPYGRRGSGDPVWSLQLKPNKDYTAAEYAMIRKHLEAGTPLRCYGVVGAGLSAINVHELPYIQQPWWKKDELKGDEDFYFSRRCVVAGRKMGVHLGLTSGEHWGAKCWRTKDTLQNLRRGLDSVEAALESAEAPTGVTENQKPSGQA